MGLLSSHRFGRRRRVRLAWSVVALAAVVAAGLALVRSGTPTAPPPRPVDNRAFLSPAAPEDPAVVWAVGDGADGSQEARVLARRIAADRPARLLYLGDVYPRGSPDDLRRRFAGVYGSLVDVTAPTPGNHEWPAHPEGYDAFWRARTGAPTPPWYALRIGGWRVLSLNSEAPHGADSAQLRWLRAELRRAPGTCTLAFWHRPLQSAGRHGDQDDVAPLWAALRGRATLVLNGHDHGSQRFRPRDGITQIVAGAGGKDLHEVDEDERLAFADDERDAALRLHLRPGSAAVSFVSAQGATLDRALLSCRER